jgi:hypothetical protein
MRLRLAQNLLPLIAMVLGCKGSPNSDPPPKPYAIPAVLTLDPRASRTGDGRVVVSGTTNLPDGFKMWVEVGNGRAAQGATKILASDDSVIVKDGRFNSLPLWLPVPNTRFTREGWPRGMEVDDRLEPFPEGKFKVRFEAYFNAAWQSAEVISDLGGEGGNKLDGPILKKTDPDVIDSPKVLDYAAALSFPPISRGAKAINLVREAILTLPDKGRSAGDVQADIDLFLSSPGVGAAKGWAAAEKSPTVYEVSYDFIDGDGENRREEQALWTANLATGEVKYENEYGKLFSWTPSY